MSLVSISLDIVGSTEIKKQLAEFSYKHGTDLDEHYYDLVRSMLVSANRFLELMHQDDVTEISRLSLVKRIGDEFWYMYDMGGLDASAMTLHATHLVKVLLAFLLEAPFDVTAFLPEAHIREELCWKCTVDLISHAIDVSNISESELDQFLMGMKRGANGTDAWDDESLSLRNNLGAGFSYLQGSEVHYKAPRDYIGLEIDRFFRIARDSERKKILAGKQFLSLLMIYSNPVSGKCSFREPIDESSFTTTLNGISVEPVEFSEAKLKGIRGGYAGAYIYNEYAELSDIEESWGALQD